MIAVEFAASEQSTFACSVDGAGAAPCASPFTASFTTEGAHTVSITATDTAGNASAAAQLSWTMDFTPPTLAWGAFIPGPGTYLSSSSLQADVVSSEIDSLSCSLNNVDLGQNSSPVSVSGLAEGPYTLSVTGTDQAGNVSPAITHYWIVDMTAPTASISADYDGVTTRQTTNNISFSANESARFECNYDGAGYSSCQSPFALSGAAEGAHTFLVRATDLAGNVGASVSVSWSVDLTAPVTSISVLQTATNAYTFNLSANEAVSVFECSMDGAAFASCGTSVSYTGLSSGTHTFTARATDTSGNLDLGGTSVSVGVVGPISTSITSTNPSAAITNRNDFTVSFTANQSGGTFRCSLDGGAEAACTSPAAYAVGSGNHTFHVIATDQFGLDDPNGGASYSWAVDRTPPISNFTVNRTANNSITFNITANEAVSEYQCAMDAGQYAPCANPATYTGLSVGTHNFFARTVDLAGNTGNGVGPYTWTIDPPVTTTISSTTPATSPTTSTSQSVSFTSNLGTASFQCNWDGAGFAACTSPASRTGLADGNHTFQVRAVDQWGTVDASGGKSYSWSVDTTAPVITVGPAATKTSTSITISYTTNEGASMQINWGIGANTNNVVAEDSNFQTGHSKTITGLLPNNTYSYIVSGHDKAGNPYVSARRTVTTNP